MRDLGSTVVVDALRAMGEVLDGLGVRLPVRLVVTGGMAGLLAGLLRPQRTTTDCDVIWEGEDVVWRQVAAAAAGVAGRLDLPPSWLNRDASIFAWCLPLGWQSRCERVGEFGPL